MAGPAAWPPSVKGANRLAVVIGNEVVMARLSTPPLHRYMTQEAYAALPRRSCSRAAAARLAKIELPTRPWACPGARTHGTAIPPTGSGSTALVERARANAIVVSGDSHAFWANEVGIHAETGGKRVAVEFGTGGDPPAQGPARASPAFLWGRPSPGTIARSCSTTRRPRALCC